MAEELRVHKMDVIQKLKKQRKIERQEAARLEKERQKKTYEESVDRLFDETDESKEVKGGLLGVAMDAAAAKEVERRAAAGRALLSKKKAASKGGTGAADLWGGDDDDDGNSSSSEDDEDDSDSD